MTKENNKDCLSNRMKRYEKQTTGINLIPNLPVYARIDMDKKVYIVNMIEKWNDELIDIKIKGVFDSFDKATQFFKQCSNDDPDAYDNGRFYKIEEFELQ